MRLNVIGLKEPVHENCFSNYKLLFALYSHIAKPENSPIQPIVSQCVHYLDNKINVTYNECVDGLFLTFHEKHRVETCMDPKRLRLTYNTSPKSMSIGNFDHFKNNILLILQNSQPLFSFPCKQLCEKKEKKTAKKK